LNNFGLFCRCHLLQTSSLYSAQEKIIEKYDITREYLWTPMSKLEQQLVSILHFCLPNALFFLLAKEQPQPS
jgi:hypothetical protein